MSINIDYVKDENYNVNVRIYRIDPASNFGKLALPTSLRLSTNPLDKRDSDNNRTLNNNKSPTAFGDDAGMSDNNTSDEAPMCPKESCVKEGSQEELREDQEVSFHDNLSPKAKVVIVSSKSPAIDDLNLDDERKIESPDLDIGITDGEQRVDEGEDSNQYLQISENTEDVSVSVSEEHKRYDSPMTSIASIIPHSNFSNTNDKPLLDDVIDKKHLQSPKEARGGGNEEDSLSKPQNISICKAPRPTNKVANSQKYSEEFRIKVVIFSKHHTHKATAEMFGIPLGTVTYWCSIYPHYKIVGDVLDEIIEAAVKSKTKRVMNYSPEFQRTVVSYANTHTPTQAANKFKVSLSSIKRWKAKQREQSPVLSKNQSVRLFSKASPDSFEDLYSDEDSLGAKKPKRRRTSNLGLDSSSDDDDANSLGVGKKRKRESTPKSNDEKESPKRPSENPHQLRLDVLDYATKHSFEEASEKFKVDMETISSWLYY